MQNINNLVNSLEKVNVISNPIKRSIKWFFISFTLMFAITCLFKIYNQQVFFNYPIKFYIENIALIFIAYCSVLSAFLYSSPDEQHQKNAKKLATFSVFVWIILFSYCLYHCLLTGHFMHMLISSLINFNNLIILLIIGFIPTVWLILMLRKAFPTHKKAIGLLTILGSLTIAIVCSSFLDSSYQATHMLIWKYTPVLLITLASYLFSEKLLSR
jgi:hypothetical protein